MAAVITICDYHMRKKVATGNAILTIREMNDRRFVMPSPLENGRRSIK
jgi:hypothetical protein